MLIWAAVCMHCINQVWFSLVAEVWSKHGEQRNLFALRACCRRQSHFVYIGQGKRIKNKFNKLINATIVLFDVKLQIGSLYEKKRSTLIFTFYRKVKPTGFFLHSILSFDQLMGGIFSYQFVCCWQTSLGVQSAWTWGCAGPTVGARTGHQTIARSRITSSIPQCWNFFGAKRWAGPAVLKTATRAHCYFIIAPEGLKPNYITLLTF